MYKEGLKPQNVFAFICLFFGLFFVFFNPPFQVPDEAQHFFKMWGFTNQTLNFKVLNNRAGDILPDSIIEIGKFDRLCFHPERRTNAQEIVSALKIPLNKDKTSFKAFTPTSYTPFSYFPAFLILWAMKLVNIPPLIMLYILRLCSLFLYTGLAYQAIKIIPFKKWLITFLALLPMTVYEAASATVDPVTMGVGFLFTAYTLKLAYDRTIVHAGKKEMAVFWTLATVLILCKYAYLPFLLLFFIIPSSKFSSQKSRCACFLLPALINIVITALFINHAAVLGHGVDTGVGGYDKKYMMAFVLTRFGWFLKLLLKTLLAYGISYFYAFIGLLGCNDTPLPFFVMNFYAVLIFTAALIKTESEEAVRLKDKLIFALVFLLTGLVIFVSAFVLFQFHDYIYGVQGRYFIPMMPLLFLLFDNKKIVWTKFHIFLIVCLIILIPFSFVTIINRFYTGI